jgi:hypothetical protein
MTREWMHSWAHKNSTKCTRLQKIFQENLDLRESNNAQNEEVSSKHSIDQVFWKKLE